LAVGNTFAAGLIVITTVAAGLTAPRLSVTTSENVTVEAAMTLGAVNVGCETVALESTATGPAVWVHVYVAMLPSESALAVPLSVTAAPALTV
jgi:hypothetical protein